MDDFVFKKLKTFIWKQGFGYTLPFPFLINKIQISRDSSLEKDLKIKGDDADEFLIAFGKEFNIDVSRFPIGNYFGNEGDIILPTFVRFLKREKKKQKKNLTAGHLERAIIVGRLDEEIIGD